VWDLVQFAANGIIFVLLGEQLPGILTSAAETVRLTGHHTPWWLGVYVIAISLGLAALRFIWVWISFQLTVFRRTGQRRAINWRIIAAMSFAGVRGAITLAGVLTLPMTMNDGTPFPARDLAGPSRQAEEDRARVGAAEAAIAAIEKLQHDLAEGRKDADIYVAAGSTIMDLYRKRIENRQGTAEDNALWRRTEKIERELRLAALKAERTQIFRMVRKRELGSELARKLIRELDLLEARYAA
jgi:hypothetical protein